MLLDFDQQDLAVLNAALMELPYKIAAPLVAKINAQISEQQLPAVQEPATEPAAAPIS